MPDSLRSDTKRIRKGREVSEFCKQCSLKIFKEDYRELANIIHQADVDVGLYAIVLCEECGPTLVDVDGTCISYNCLEKHGVDTEYESWLK